jgi:hypothetical protein
MHTDFVLDYMARRRDSSIATAFAEVAERGPISAGELSNPGKRKGRWWAWSDGKQAMEYLYDAGLVAIAGRRGFERLYDLAERVIPREVLDAPAPKPEEAMKQLICLAAKAYGVGTARDVTGYFMTNGWRDRLPLEPWWERPKGWHAPRSKPIGARLVRELVEEGRLLPATVEGWREQAYLDPGARIPRSVQARALVTPFDSLVWERERVDRLFGMKYTIELYTPAPKRVYGYYVCPFLLGDTLVGRTDLKADRRRGVLMVQSAFVEPGQKAGPVAAGLADELELMRTWLGLDRIEVARKGDLAAALRRSVAAA